MAEGVGARIAEQARIGRAAAAEGVEDEEQGAGQDGPYWLTTPVRSASMLKAAANRARV